MSVTSIVVMFPSSHVDEGRRKHLFVLGARAEAMMPNHLWNMIRPYRLHLTMIGNHVPVMRGVARTSNVKEDNDDPVHLSYHSQLFHQHVSMAKNKEKDKVNKVPDGFVLFNPGLGHPHLERLWSPSISLALQHLRPLLITSFSAVDLERDLRVLHATAKSLNSTLRFMYPPQLNPFKSLKYTVDPAQLLAPVQTNQYAMVIQLRESTVG
jgi:splicing suppressor protein 51